MPRQRLATGLLDVSFAPDMGATERQPNETIVKTHATHIKTKHVVLTMVLRVVNHKSV